MILESPLQTQRLVLRTLDAGDAGPQYLSWLRDPEVIRYLEVRFTLVHGTRQLVSYIEAVRASADSLLMGIFLKDGRHIGNIKLGPLVTSHRRSEIGFLIGEKNCWGHGYAAEAIAAVCYYAFEQLGLEKITAGCYEINAGSIKAMKKAGFVHEATIPSHVIVEGRRAPSVLFGLGRPRASSLP